MKDNSFYHVTFRFTTTLLGLGLALSLTAQVQEAWVRTYNHGQVDGANAMALDGQGNVYVTGFSATNNQHDIVTLKYGPDGTHHWTARYEGPANASDSGSAIAVGRAGESWVTGLSQGTNAVTAYVTIKYDSNGVPAWVRRIETLGNYAPAPVGLVVDTDGNAYLAGSRNLHGIGEEFLVAKYSPAGTLLWVRYQGAGTSARSSAIVLDSSYNVIVTGSASGLRDAYDIMTVKFDAAGNLIWSARYDGNGNNEHQSPHGLCVDTNGNIYITGERSSGISAEFLTLKYSPAGAVLWAAAYSPQPSPFASAAGAVQVDSVGHVYVTGQAIHAAGNNWAHDICTVKYDANGNELWAARVNGELPGYPSLNSALVIDDTGEVYISDSYGLAAVKYGAAGNLVWKAARNSALGRSLAIDRAGNVFLAGQLINISPSAPFDYYDLAVVKYAQIAGASSPVAFVSPSRQEAIVGSNVLFSANITGPGPFTYQWRFRGQPIANATSPELNLASVQPGAAGDYSVIVSNATGYTISPEARLVLHLPPVIHSMAQTNKVVVGETVAWTVAASGDLPLSYRWLFNGLDIPGAATASLSITNLQESASGLYTVVISNEYGVAVSEPYQLTVVPSFLTISLKGAWPGLPRTNGFAQAVRVVGNRAYLADSFAGLQIIDVSEPASPVWLGRYETGGYAHDVEVIGTMAYVADILTGLHLIDVSDPAHPIGISVYDAGAPGVGSESPHALRVVNNLAYCVDGNVPQVHVVDVSNPTLPIRVGAIPFVGHAEGLDVVSNRLYLVGSRPVGEDDDIGFVQIYDLRDLTNAVLVGTTDTATRGHGVAMMGAHAYVVGEGTALTTVDVSNPASPTALGWFSTYGWAEAIQVSGNWAYIAGEYVGLAVLDVSDPAIPFRVAQYPLGTGEDEGWDVQVVGGYAYLARGFAGLLILEIKDVRSELSIEQEGDQVRVSWSSAPGVKLQRSTAFTNSNWQDVPGTSGTNSAQLPVQGGSSFFRLVKP